MERPRLLIAVTSPMSAGFFRGQLAWLEADGFEVHFLCAKGQPAEDITTVERAVFHPVPLVREISPWRDLCTFVRLVRLIAHLRPHIVNAGTPKAGLLVTLAAWVCAVPVRIYTIHGLRFETVHGPVRRLLIAIERVICSCATHVIAVGPGLRSLVVEHRLCASRRVVVQAQGSANGIDLQAFSRDDWCRAGADLRRSLGIPPKAPVIGFVGRLVRDKGISELTRAWEDIRQRHPSVHLLIVGDVETGDPVSIDDAKRLRDDARVHITGFVSEVRPAYAAMQVLALPTYREGLPTVLLEAAAMEVPAVASDIPGCRDVIIQGISGHLIPVHDVAALSRSLSDLLAAPALAESIGLAARQHVERRFNQRQVWVWLTGFYREVSGVSQEGRARNGVGHEGSP